MRRTLSALLGLALALPPHAAEAGRALALDELIDRADEIVVGDVVVSAGRWEGKLVVTDTTVRVDESLKGGAPREITLTQLGGTVVHPRLGVRVTTEASGVATLRPGEQVVLFVGRRGGRRHLVGGPRGKLVIADEPPADAKAAGRPPAKTLTVGPKRLRAERDAAGTIAARGMTLDELRARVRARAKGDPR